MQILAIGSLLFKGGVIPLNNSESRHLPTLPLISIVHLVLGC